MDKVNELWDVAVVGAGAAGLMTAVTCRRAGLKVLLLDGREKIGAKILISGGTRCNITNQRITEKDFQSESPRVVKRILQTFSSASVVEFFRGIGVETVLEEDGKFFPATHSAQTVLDSLLNECRRLEVRLETGRKVSRLAFDGHYFQVAGMNFLHTARAAVLCTGGLSYPSTGSDGSGYGLGTFFGHSLIPTSPALTPLVTDDPDWKSLSGIALPVCLVLDDGGKKGVKYEGPMLFTHFGFSGPAALNMSRHWIRRQSGRAAEPVPRGRLTVNFLPHYREDDFREQVVAAMRKTPSRLVKNLVSEKLPERLADIVIKKTGLSPARVFNQLKKTEREKLIQGLFHAPLKVTGVVGYLKAEATAGGIDLAEVNSSTLESKKRTGLFFAGEILDVDGRIGGFNFQWAWSSGVAAALGVIRKIHEKQTA